MARRKREPRANYSELIKAQEQRIKDKAERHPEKSVDGDYDEIPDPDGYSFDRTDHGDAEEWF